MIESVLRSLPDFRGKRRLAKILFKKQINSRTEKKVSGKFNCVYTLPNIKENVAFNIFINGIYEEDTFRFLKLMVPQNALFLDLGANIGSISIPLCKSRTDVKVFGVEASPWVMRYLAANIRDNGLESRISTHNYALFDKDNVTLPFHSPKAFFGQGSLSVASRTEDCIEVEGVRLDTLLQRNDVQKVDFLKIDIEGFEYFAFKGAEKLLSSSNAPDILFEFADWCEKRAGIDPGSSQQYLMDQGYKIYQLIDNKPVLLEKKLTSGFCLLFASKKPQK